jgi:hypothetical protein
VSRQRERNKRAKWTRIERSARELFASRGFSDASMRAIAARARDDAGLVDALMELFGGFLDFYARNPELSAAILREFFFRPYEPERLGSRLVSREEAERRMREALRLQIEGLRPVTRRRSR